MALCSVIQGACPANDQYFFLNSSQHKEINFHYNPLKVVIYLPTYNRNQCEMSKRGVSSAKTAMKCQLNSGHNGKHYT